MIAHFDLDCVKYSVASAGEKRSIRVTHKINTSITHELKTRTEWYGHHSKKNGGLLSQINALRDSPFDWTEFDIEDIQTPEPIQNVLNSAKVMTQSSVYNSGAEHAEYYIGKGKSFRVAYSHMQEYKGQRGVVLKPVYLDTVSDYLEQKFKAKVITNYEADDAVVMNAYGKKDHFIIGIDKDYYGSGSKFFNINRLDEGIIDTSGFGVLWLDSKGKVRGAGRMFKMWQVCSEDDTDNYAANACSDVKWAGKGAYNKLVNCANDFELFSTARDIFKMLYPEPKTITTWYGEQYELTWLKAFQECFDMAHMHRWEGDFINLATVMDKLGVSIE